MVENRIYVTDVDDDGTPLGGLFAFSDTKFYRVELAPGAIYISADHERRYEGETGGDS